MASFLATLRSATYHWSSHKRQQIETEKTVKEFLKWHLELDDAEVEDYINGA